MKRGLLIVLDGIDGAGKGTQAKLLADRLEAEGRAVRRVSFPRYGTPGAKLVELYLNGAIASDPKDVPARAASVFYSMDRHMAAPELRSWLEAGDLIISDRYVASNMGHQGGKIENEKEFQGYICWLEDLEYNQLEVPRPDLNIIFHVSPEVSQANVDRKAARDYTEMKRDIHEGDTAHLAAASAVYRRIATTLPGFCLIDAAPDGQMLSIEDIHAQVWEQVRKILD